MKKLALIVALVCVGFVTYNTMMTSSEAARVYQEFADALAYNQWDTASQLTVPNSQAHQKLMIRQARRGIGLGGTYSITGTSYSLQSETRATDTSVDVEMNQTVRVSGGGQESAFGRPVDYRHSAHLEQTEVGWRVVRYERERIVD